jgi:diguanylate cyclase (GGDEF)-like protein/PAS domain S-box-containing protein
VTVGVAGTGGEHAVPGVRRGRRVIGFVAPNVHGYFYGSLLAGLQAAVAARGGARVVAIQTHDAGISAFGQELFAERPAWDHLDALVVTQATVSGEYLRAFAGTGRPVVTLFEAPKGFACPTVVPDNDQGVGASIDHLVAHGHTDIAFVGRDPGNADDEIRYRAYRAAVAAHELQPREPVLISWQLDETYHGSEAVAQLRSGGALPTAVMACTDATAMALVGALSQAGIAVPDEVAVIGFDDISEAAEFRPPLSTVAQSFTIAGARAATLVLDALDGHPGEPGPHCTPVSLVVRESCGCSDAGLDVAGVPTDLEGACAGFVTDLGSVLADGKGRLAPSGQRELLAVGRRLVDLFAGVARTPPATLDGADVAMATALRHLVGSSNLLGATEPVHALARAVAACRCPQDTAGALRLERLSADLTSRLLRTHKCGQGNAVVNQHVEIQRRYYMISTDLVRRYQQDARSLSWLAGTEVRAACFALWENGRDGRSGTAMRIVGTYTEGTSTEPGAAGITDEPCGVQAFPPPSFLDLLDDDPDDLVFVLPVRFDGSDWGFLALSGPFDVREEESFERFNHWAVLLTVALDQERAMRSERALRGIQVSEERYALAAEAANDGLWDWDLESGQVYYSTRWKALLGYADDEIGATSDEWLKRIHPADRADVDRALEHLDGVVPTIELEHRVRAADGTYHWMLTQARAVRDAVGTLVRVVGSMTDITQRKDLEERLRHDAHYDSLTGLPNRALFLDRLDRAIARARRHPSHSFAVVFLDLDSFKVVNDSLGHQVGDEVLIQVAKRLSVEVRANDTVSRFGGDEFVLLLENVRDMAQLPITVRRMLAALSVPLTLAERSRVVSVTAGIAVSAAGYRTPDEYVRDADTAMYRAKALGPGSVVMFDEAMHAGAMDRLQRELDLDQAIAGGQFELYYQPIMRLDQRRAVGMEALIRWHHPDQGLVPPNDFLPVAEITGQARQIGLWTLTDACRQIRVWLDDITCRSDFTVSVNLSNLQFWDPQIMDALKGAMATYDVPASMLVIEVTEGVIMQNQEAASLLMRQLGDAGIKLHVDDFGTGYSSLSALHTFPIDAFKIDRSFVHQMRTDERSQELVSLMINMGARLGIAVIAEGIETEEDAAVLADLGCPLVQGYLFSRPVPGDRAARFLRRDPV